MNDAKQDEACLLVCGLCPSARKELFARTQELSEDDLVQMLFQGSAQARVVKLRHPELPAPLFPYLGILLALCRPRRKLIADANRQPSGAKPGGDGRIRKAPAQTRWRASPKARMVLNYWPELIGWKREGKSFREIAKLIRDKHHEKVTGEYVRQLWNAHDG